MHKQDFIKQKPQYTRKISPKLGLLGFFGLFGFLGFVPQFFGESGALDVPFPLIFFCFFGFFVFTAPNSPEVFFAAFCCDLRINLSDS